MTYRVEIYEIKTNKVHTVVGEGMSEDKADKRLFTACMRCNEDFGARIINEQTGEEV